ncbi:MAG: glycoside hydrolase family 15 protein [Candidatus Dormibacteraeota bacterium]|nr:glycoside hydrolase family 15 protein [Candidatus Dormibacteraeota bacterium]MBV9524813.1 glycoside hydrolase family 15 protein [Candidatus Dormibacteraeota bacterium]
MTDNAGRRADGYLPLSQYGLIGDCRTAALVGADGSIDWLCLPRFDDEALFCRILDAHTGGYWQIRPSDSYSVRQRYRDRTNILDTIYSTDGGLAIVTDFMPVVHHELHQHARLHNEPRLVRIVECLAGEVTLQHEFHPAPSYGRVPAEFSVHGNHVHAACGKVHLCLTTTAPDAAPESRVTLRMGETHAFSLRATRAGKCAVRAWNVEDARELMRATQQFWWRWIGQCSYAGPYQQVVWRSALALKLMSYSPTGAIVAAPTTSLPEWIGGDRNWDYRYTWLRDASFTLFALFQLDLTGEAEGFFHWLRHRHLGERSRTVPNLFDLDGHSHRTEVELDHLDGYRHSRPVRVGNAAAHQLQLDVYGEVLDGAYVYARFGGVISRELWRELRAIVDLAIDRWEEADSSIWEARSQRAQYTYSKLMCWVAVDRGIRIADRWNHPHDHDRWRAARRAIRKRILTEGWSEERGAFTQVLGGDALDSAMLRISQVRLLGDRDPRVVSTIRAIEQNLGEGVLVRRYRTEETDDGLKGAEGAFFMTSFWLADALAHIGDLEGAQRRFERLLSFSSPLGLFSEEVDPRSGELLGNYPQAFTHLALVGAAVNIERARNRRIGVRGLRR